MRKSKKHPGRCGARNTLFVVGTPDTDSPQPVDQDSAADPQTETIYLAGGSMAKPAYQARSRQRHVDLIQAGLKLIQTRDFDDLPVSAIVAEAGCAVGSFYTRFEDKDAYFAALQLSVLDQIRDEAADWFAEQPWSSAPVAECIERLVGWLVHNFVRHRGVIRAAHKHGANQPGVWSPMRSIGQEWGFAACERIAPRLTDVPEPVRSKEFMIAMQFCYGALVNLVVNDAGPLKLNDPELPKALSRAFNGYLREAAA